jgi:hypothetical protein
MPSSLLEPYRHQAYIPARRALDALTLLQRQWMNSPAASLDAARLKRIISSLEKYVATLRSPEGDHLGEYPRVVAIIDDLSDFRSPALDSIVGDLEHSRTEIDNN